MNEEATEFVPKSYATTGRHGHTRPERARRAVPMVADIANAALQVVYAAWTFFVDVAPNRFGLILVPLVFLGVVSLWAARKPLAR